jgi:hypothetical protein
MDKLVGLITVVIMIGIFVVNMVPAILTKDSGEVQEAADRTTERLLDFATD